MAWMGGNANAQAPQRPRTVSVELAKAERKSAPVDVDAIGMVTPISSAIVGGLPLPVNFSGALIGVMIWTTLFVALHWLAQHVLEGLQE